MRLTLEELKAATDLDLGTSRFLTIDQETIDGFAEVTGDRQWIHVDVERAASSPFGSTVAHGYLTLSLLPRLLFELFQVEDAGAIVNYGVDKLRFLAPVPSGSEVALQARIVSATERPGGGVLFRVRGDLRLREPPRRALVVETLFVAQPA